MNGRGRRSLPARNDYRIPQCTVSRASGYLPAMPGDRHRLPLHSPRFLVPVWSTLTLLTEREIALTETTLSIGVKRITPTEYIVAGSNRRLYTVHLRPAPNVATCDCPQYIYNPSTRALGCKHITEVRHHAEHL